MASYRRRTNTTYHTYGSVSYAPVYDGNAVRAPRREEETYVAPRPKQRDQVRRHERAQAEVREAGQVAPFAVVGFLAVALFAVMLVASYAQLAVANKELSSLQNELSTLQSENVKLSAQYEKVFDMATLEAALGDTMVRPTGDQITYIDLSAPDTVTVYGEERSPGLFGVLKGIGNVLDGVVEYFR